ncbi:5'-methylthioadenosine/S-adenosylhomocysteine nucleosidase family protein [Thermogemmatispora tikiterensis]|uniref:Nucleoside phosphorylase domain-containing protein n=1 Tax=Thermogemmatispora tikiterensis TaxID=1825093 RepID=A0A328VGC2_9CHLR|nr:hypothetical protein [Thermogemmatispora tikiterensis]RAQ96547.1 hypothetical protein A4R35_13455 [Thermogemmatispora tikiterensis]
METDVPQALKHLARLLDLRKRQGDQPYRVVITLAASLNAEVRKAICHSESWSDLRAYLQQLGLHDRLGVLAYGLALQEASQNLIGYRALARLCKQGYFTTILTGGIDASLERAFVSENVGLEQLCQLVLGRESEIYLQEKLRDHARRREILLLKLFGSLEAGLLAPDFPDLLEFPSPLREILEHELNEDLIIIGSPTQEEAILRLLSTTSRSSIYYVSPQPPAEDDRLLRIIEARHRESAPFLIWGTYGQPTHFFAELEALLRSQQALTVTVTEQETQSAAFPAEAAQQAIEQRVVSPPAALLTGGARALQPGLHADVLLVTVTEIEAQAVLALFSQVERYYIDQKTYYLLGEVSGTSLVMVQSEMGQGGVAGSLLTVSEGIRHLQPRAVIMVGIAFGLKPDEQHIGDILVARQILAYELQAVVAREGQRSVRLRGDRVTASPLLLDRFKSGVKSWSGQRVQFGLLLSGEKLINDKEYRDQLQALEPEAIGGEMEGAGLCAAAQHHKVDWILVKAIADWADGFKHVNKERRQRKAASNAARFTLHVLAQGGLAPLATGLAQTG